jgi:transcriptional regulator with XRE-family HTH domain
MGRARFVAKEFGERVRNGRKPLNWSQADLSKRLSANGFPHIYPTTVAKIESGERSVRVEEAAAIADLYGTSLDALLGRNVDADAELSFVLRGITSSAERSAKQVGEIVTEMEQAREDLGTLGEFAGRDVLAADIKRTMQKLTAAQGALATTARFERGMTAAPTREELGR